MPQPFLNHLTGPFGQKRIWSGKSRVHFGTLFPLFKSPISINPALLQSISSIFDTLSFQNTIYRGCKIKQDQGKHWVFIVIKIELELRIEYFVCMYIKKYFTSLVLRPCYLIYTVDEHFVGFFKYINKVHMASNY